MNPFDYVTNLARAITDKADATPRAHLVAATVRAFYPSPDRSLPIAEVHVHGDPDTATIHAQVITGELDPGDMTVVLFDPPEAAYCWGQAPPAVIVPEGDWTITPTSEQPESGQTTIYTFDGDYTIGNIPFSGAMTTGTGVFKAWKNGVVVAQQSVSDTGAFSLELEVNEAFTSGDELYFTWGGIGEGSDLTFTGFNVAGNHPINENDAIGATENYIIHASSLDGEVGPGALLDENEAHGTGTDTDFPGPPYDYLVENDWAPAPAVEVWTYVWGGTSNSLTHDWSVESATVAFAFTGTDPLNVKLEFDPDGTGFPTEGFTGISDDVSADGTLTYTFVSPPVFTTSLDQPADSVPVFKASFTVPEFEGTLTTFTAGLEGDHVDETVDWIGGG